MAQPYDYTLPNPMIAFEQAYKFGNSIAASKAEDLNNEKAKIALQSVATDRSPENIARVFRDFPALREQITASESVLNEAQKAADNEFRSQVIGLTKSGNIDLARARLQSQADGYANTVGKEKEAKAANAMLQVFDKDPDAVSMTLGIQLAGSNKDLYEALFKGSELTSFQKSLVAADINPKSPRGIALAEAFAVNQADPLVEIATPSGGKFVGPRSEYFKRYGENAPAPAAIAPVEAIEMLLTGQGTAADFDAIFGKGKAAEYLKLKGGQTGKPSGNFQGQ
jgi:hypothetical protein